MTKGPKTRIGAWLARPLASFHLVVTVAVMLTVLGLVMVLSASSVEAYAENKSAYSMFLKQAMFAVVGFVLFYVALRLPIRSMRAMSFPVFVTTVVLLVLVLIPGIGTEAQGTRGWFVIGPLSVQPSELAKIAFAIWGAHVLASRRGEITTIKELLVPLVPAALVVFVLIILQPDLGTTVSLIIILFALLWYGGLPIKLFLAILGTGVVSVAILALTAGYRSDRVRAFFDSDADPQGTGYQARQAMYSLADGGIFGRGLGQSVAKWSYLPNSHNDFIFAIIGEELGFVGGAAVIGLFALFVYTGLRIAARSSDPFLRILTATVTTWITGQAFINIGYVVGLLPVTGLQLPLVSAGGTSTATTLFMFGVVANAARHEPEAIAALHSGQDGRISKLLRLPMPVPFQSVRPSRPRGSAESSRSRGSAESSRSRGSAESSRKAPAGQNGRRRQAPTRKTHDAHEVRERGIRR
ncbi:putative lipid II flippase FtsW [Rhodococcus sp. IEGM 1366]|jgi:cell division protein FtsW|uniref:putative lipid II flippase FtsW n=1 Tax=unclassified Rhodococcus (in: high G+C Gram-positive bacteria) TaxID=192944 RepID=UPI0011431924|nr:MULTISPECIES: putative lipid II flippase FtsW [unclassified Rhodococcus (in: high G+C Gram-positive bacteria)]MDV8066487.1 putative lipid II flippase FtsW [Rhodococcus sp. IEGM 1366]ROZ48680.1 putative lipid II flippase FtsW [Rhodococcus sp. WS3]